METVADFIFLDSKITVDGDCSHEIKRHLFFGRKAMTSLDTIKKKQSCPFADGLPLWLRQRRIHLQRRRPRFDPWVSKSSGKGNGNPLANIQGIFG